MSVLLDTNACIAAIGGLPPTVRARVDETAAAGERVFVSSISLFELWYGIGYSARAAENAEQLRIFLDSSIETMSFDEADARAAGVVRAQLRRQGTPIGPYDCLIAGQAIRRDLLLVTANVREFSRVQGLRWEDWTKPA